MKPFIKEMLTPTWEEELKTCFHENLTQQEVHTLVHNLMARRLNEAFNKWMVEWGKYIKQEMEKITLLQNN